MGWDRPPIKGVVVEAWTTCEKHSPVCRKQVAGWWVRGFAAVVQGWVGEETAVLQIAVQYMLVFGDYVAGRFEVVDGGRAMKFRYSV